MSRFLQVIEAWDQPLTYHGICEICREVRNRLEAAEAFIKMKLPYFVTRTSPVSKKSGVLRLDVELDVEVKDDSDLVVTVTGPATSLCPCSKEISEYGAHNQRCRLRTSVRFRGADSIGVNELFEMMEWSASASVYPVLKRSDEKFVTEQAYHNPRFVEDTVRDLAAALKSDPRIAWFRCSSENFESIHQHNAYAQIESQKADS